MRNTGFINMKYTFKTLMHSERPKLYTILVFLSAIGLKNNVLKPDFDCNLESWSIVCHVL